jgi:T4 bacteriophage base plate protein
MPLPKIDLQIYELKLVSKEKPVKFRPFLVKEEKLLLMALQNGKEEDILKTVKQVINNCLLEEIDIDKIPIFDIEYLFLNIRARSVGEKVESYFVCKNVVGVNKNEESEEQSIECGHMMPVEINVLDIKPPIDNISTKIKFNQTVGMQLKFPTLETYKSIQSLTLSEDVNDLYNMIYDCCEYIFDNDDLFYTNETSKEEFMGFLEGLTQEQFTQITNFFESLPTISYDLIHNCQKCNFQHKLHMEGLSDFFT